jgi:aspartyl-tRNA(Asn)/glutamyl-tRNA(Gln) amidotransferase subunit C
VYTCKSRQNNPFGPAEASEIDSRETFRPDTQGVQEPVPTISRDEVAHLARLARLAVTDDELDVFAGQLGVILESVASVSEVAADDIPPTSHAVPLTNVFRDDVERPGLTREQALAGVPAAVDGRFRVPRILDEQA